MASKSFVTEMIAQSSTVFRKSFVQRIFYRKRKSSSWHFQGPQELFSSKSPTCWFWWTPQQCASAQPRSKCRWPNLKTEVSAQSKDFKLRYFSKRDTQNSTLLFSPNPCETLKSRWLYIPLKDCPLSVISSCWSIDNIVWEPNLQLVVKKWERVTGYEPDQ